MSWVITGSEKTPIDKQGIQNVSLLLHGDGTNGSTTIIDSSPSPITLTSSNATVSTAQSKYGSGSLFFNGNAGIISASNQNLILGSTWTVEWWWLLNTVGSGSNRNTLFEIGSIGSTGALAIYQEGAGGDLRVRGGASGSDAIATAAVSSGAWDFFAVSCTNNSATIYKNGILAGGPTTLNSAVTATAIRIGSMAVSNDYNTDGYIDDLRITKGIARYTANFTPPTAAFPDI